MDVFLPDSPPSAEVPGTVLQRDVPHGQHVQVVLRKVLTVPLVVVLHLEHLRSPGLKKGRLGRTAVLSKGTQRLGKECKNREKSVTS